MTCCFFLLEHGEPSVTLAFSKQGAQRAQVKDITSYQLQKSESPDFLSKCQIQANSKRAWNRLNWSILDESWHHLKLFTREIRNILFFFD